MDPFPHLRDLQSIFWRLLSAPEGAAQGAAALRREGVLESEDLSFLVRSDARLDAVERVEIYADMYFYRLRDCLAEDFPKLAAQLGSARFHNLVTDYLLAHPSSHFSLRELGRPLPGYLADHELAREGPTLADLAALEWARVDVFDAADAVPISREQLLERGAAAPETFRIARVPACRLLRIDASILPQWKRLDDAASAGGEEAGLAAGAGDRIHAEEASPPDRVPLSNEPCAVLVWRKDFGVYHRSLAADEAACLEAISADGARLARLGEIAAEHAGPERAGARLAELLALWTRDEVVTSIEATHA